MDRGSDNAGSGSFEEPTDEKDHPSDKIPVVEKIVGLKSQNSDAMSSGHVATPETEGIIPLRRAIFDGNWKHGCGVKAKT